MQTGVFLLLFLSTAQMPLHLLTGWLHSVARVNPMSNIASTRPPGLPRRRRMVDDLARPDLDRRPDGVRAASRLGRNAPGDPLS